MIVSITNVSKLISSTSSSNGVQSKRVRPATLASPINLSNIQFSSPRISEEDVKVTLSSNMKIPPTVPLPSREPIELSIPLVKVTNTKDSSVGPSVLNQLLVLAQKVVPVVTASLPIAVNSVLVNPVNQGASLVGMVDSGNLVPYVLLLRG
jgi:hypothetical protein